MSDDKDQSRAREEFLAEAQELVETLSRDLLLLDDSQRRDQSNPDALNDLFRGVHTLKGLAGMFGFSRIGAIAHAMEDLLEDLRLGRVELSQQALDVLFQGGEFFQRLMVEALTGEAAAIDQEAFLARIQSVTRTEGTASDVLAEFELEPDMLAVLTEYEEHRLRANLEAGVTVYRVAVKLPLEVIDSALEEIKERTRGVAEIVTYLPSMAGGSTDTIDIEMLVAAVAGESELRASLNRTDARITEVTRRTGQSPASPPASPTAMAPLPQASSEPSELPAPPLVPSGEPAASLRSLSSAVRVDIRKLDHLMNVVGELGAVRNGLLRMMERLRSQGDAQRELARDAYRLHRSFHRYLTEVQEGVLDIRMVPLAQLFDKVAVAVRQVARELDKDVRLQLRGSETEVDKLIAEELADPLMHLVRNSIDHGIEAQQGRAQANKESTAVLSIDAYHKGNHVVVEVSDDGRGIDTVAIRDAAIRKGLLSEQAAADISRDDLLQVVFAPGFSTALRVTDLSGRGVGMDVVKTNINRLGGAVDVASEVGRGTTVTITLPITLAIISSLLFEVRGRVMSVPLSSVQEALRLDEKALTTVEGRTVMTLRDETLALCRLGDMFGFDGKDQGHFVIVVVVGNRRLGLVVDKLAGQHDIVIKGLGRSLRNVPGISGATDLGDQKLVLVLDAAAIMEEVLSPKGGHLALGSELS